MHELSIARAIVSEVEASAIEHGIERVGTVTLRLGRLAGVVEDSLRFGLEIAAEGTRLEGAALVVEFEPVIVWCPNGGHTLELPPEQCLRFHCDEHDCACPELLSGRDLEIRSYSAERPAEGYDQAEVPQ